MGNYNALEIVGVGTIILKMQDDIVHKIKVVRHVKGVKKDSFSIGQLDDLECVIHTESGILKVVKGNLLVMKAKKITETIMVILKVVKGNLDEVSDKGVRRSMRQMHKPS